MYTLLIRLAGPLQSWGTDSKFESRRTERFPTKSGIIGLLAAALGRSREEDIGDLARLRIGVRVDQPGTIISDFHTARKDAKTSYITKRDYLSDAVFLVGIESKSCEELETLKAALQAPAYPLFLGRRSCPPTLPIVEKIIPQPLREALTDFEWTGQGRAPATLKLYLEGEDGQLTYRLHDYPESYSVKNRTYKDRLLSEDSIRTPEEPDRTKRPYTTEQDVFSEL